MIQSTDIQFLLSAPQAAAGYVMPGSPGNSLGLFCSTTQLSATAYDNLFADLSGAQNAALQVDYACVFIYNSNSADAMLNPMAWLPTSLLGPSNTVTFQIGADPTPPSPLSSETVQAVAIQTPLIAPSNVSWTAPSSLAVGGVALPAIPPHYVAAVWVQRTAAGTASGNAFTIEVTFDSLA